MPEILEGAEMQSICAGAPEPRLRFSPSFQHRRIFRHFPSRISPRFLQRGAHRDGEGAQHLESMLGFDRQPLIIERSNASIIQ
jgi:hypothetical protein